MHEILLKPKYTNLKQLSLIGFTNGNITIQALYSLLVLQNICPSFIQNLEFLEINAVNLEGEQVFDKLNAILLKMTNLKNIKLVGTGIGENLGELT